MGNHHIGGTEGTTTTGEEEETAEQTTQNTAAMFALGRSIAQQIMAEEEAADGGGGGGAAAVHALADLAPRPLEDGHDFVESVAQVLIDIASHPDVYAPPKFNSSGCRVAVRMHIPVATLSTQELARLVDAVTWNNTLFPGWAQEQMAKVTPDTDLWAHGDTNWGSLANVAFMALHAPLEETRAAARTCLGL